MKRARAALPLLLLALAAGCASIGKSLGRSAMSGVQSYVRNAPTSDSTRAMLDSLGRYARLSFERHAAPSLDATSVALLTRGRAALDTSTIALLARGRAALDTASLQLFASTRQEVDRVEADLAQAIRTEWSQALQELVRANLRSGGAQAGRELSQLVHGFGVDADTALVPRLDSVVAMTAAHATDSASVRLARQLSGELRAGFLAIADTLARVGARAAVEEADLAWSRGRVLRITLWVAGGVILALLALAGAWLWRDRRRSREALDVLARTIRDARDPALKEEVKKRATQGQVEPWLRGFLQERGYL